MPKAKPMSLNPAARRKAEIESRIRAELSLAPISELPSDPPQLKGRPYALAVYRRLMELYSETIAEIVTAFDLDVMVEYCISQQEQYELAAMRAVVLELWQALQKRLKARGRKNYSELVGEADYLMTRIVALDARLDAKRGLSQKLRQSLYLTPASRAGVAPPPKPAQPEADEMDAILADANSALDGDG